MGFGQVAYLFDYLDDLFQKQIASYFKKIWEQALKVPKLSKYNDPYEINSMLNNKKFLNSLSGEVSIEKMSNEELIRRMKLITPNFDIEVYKNSINLQQLDFILKNWGYFRKYDKRNVAKFILDKYDVDGDGRLNAREFLLLSIASNEHILGSGHCKHCYSEVISSKIDPIFEFIDCSARTAVSTEDICNGIKFLKRKTAAYDMFKCKIKGAFYNSSACNDLILKNADSSQGGLTKPEFRIAILLGYWDRQTHEKGIYMGDEINEKSKRWSNDGQVDLFCHTLGYYTK